jgi:hypothetical protein
MAWDLSIDFQSRDDDGLPGVVENAERRILLVRVFPGLVAENRVRLRQRHA